MSYILGTENATWKEAKVFCSENSMWNNISEVLELEHSLSILNETVASFWLPNKSVSEWIWQSGSIPISHYVTTYLHIAVM